MVELLAIPKWKQSPRPLDDWLSALHALNLSPSLERQDSDAYWINLNPLRTRGYTLIEDGLVTAVHFEIHDPDPSESRSLLEQAAASLGWELHDDDNEHDDD